MKQCRTCNKLKEDTDYYLCKRKGGNPEARHTECKECTKERVKKNHNPERARDLHLQRNYDITLAEWNKMLEEQGTKCAICPSTKPGGKHNQWCVDHDHLTGQVRQLLCSDCNLVLGIVRDSTEHLERLIAYVIKHASSEKSL